MNLQKLPQSSCEIRFGVSGLNNPSLLEQLYPEDLPEDWRLSYYSNEFHLLLISLLDLSIPSSSQQEMKAIVPDEIIQALVQFSDELEQDFVLIFDLTKFSDKIQNVLLDVQKKEAAKCYFINLNKVNEEAQIACSTRPASFFSLLKGNSSHSNNPEQGSGSLLCVVADEQEIAAVELRQLIEQVRAYTLAKQYKAVNIVFSSAQNALKNCRNAILLESMM